MERSDELNAQGRGMLKDDRKWPGIFKVHRNGSNDYARLIHQAIVMSKINDMPGEF